MLIVSRDAIRTAYVYVINIAMCLLHKYMYVHNCFHNKLNYEDIPTEENHKQKDLVFYTTINNKSNTYMYVYMYGCTV